MDPEMQDRPEDVRLSEIASLLRRNENAPGLWSRIERDLQARQACTPLELHTLRRRKVLRNLASLAAAAVLIGATVLVLIQADAQRPPLLLERDAADLAETEKADFELELARLEPLFMEETAQRSDEAALLTGHLEILDARIDSCRDAWKSNRLNRGVQRSLLNGYRKKLELMKNFISAR